MKAPYGVLLISGFHTHQEIYARFFADDPRCKLVGVADEACASERRHTKNRQFAEEWELPYLPDLDTALSRDDVQIVSICAEHERRGRVTVQCAEAGKHLYLDKPIACSVADADAIVAATERAGVMSQMFSFVYAPWAQQARRIVESGVLGELLSIHCDILFAKGNTGTASLGHIRREDEVPRNFTFLDSKHELRATGVYSVAMIHWLAQRPVESVYCVTGNYFFEEHQKNNVEDFGLLTMDLQGGVSASITAGRIGWTSHPHAGPSEIHLIGSEGIAKVDARRPRIEIASGASAWEQPRPHPEDPMGFWPGTLKESGVLPKERWIPIAMPAQNDVNFFIDCIESGQESEMTAKDGAALVETLMAGYVSASRGEPVSLPLPKELRR